MEENNWFLQGTSLPGQSVRDKFWGAPGPRKMTVAFVCFYRMAFFIK